LIVEYHKIDEVWKFDCIKII